MLTLSFRKRNGDLLLVEDSGAVGAANSLDVDLGLAVRAGIGGGSGFFFLFLLLCECGCLGYSAVYGFEHEEQHERYNKEVNDSRNERAVIEIYSVYGELAADYLHNAVFVFLGTACDNAYQGVDETIGEHSVIP